MSSSKSTLSEAQKSRFKRLLSTVQVDKVTVSFSIEERDPSGRKKSVFVSLTASRGAGAEVPQMHEDSESTGYTMEEARIIRLALSREVVKGAYDDAFRRRVLPRDEETVSEMKQVLKSYEDILAQATGVDPVPKDGTNE